MIEACGNGLPTRGESRAANCDTGLAMDKDTGTELWLCNILLPDRNDLEVWGEDDIMMGDETVWTNVGCRVVGELALAACNAESHAFSSCSEVAWM
jgi:hypothetical protein